MLSYYLCRAARRAKFFLYTFILPLLDFGRGRPQYIKIASLRYAVSAAEPPCTHGKDHPGLGPPNSLKLGAISCY